MKQDRQQMSVADLEILALIALDAVAAVEGWDGEHASWKLRDGFNPEPSRKFIAEFRRRLPRRFKVIPRKKGAD